MERQKKVVDASVIVKLFAKEEGTEKTFELLKSHINGEIRIIVPELIFMETLNALRYKKLDKKVLERANKDLWDFQLEVLQLDKFLLNKSIENALENNLSVYDSVYFSIAQIHGAPLITADEKLLKLPNSVSLDEV